MKKWMQQLQPIDINNFLEQYKNTDTTEANLAENIKWIWLAQQNWNPEYLF